MTKSLKLQNVRFSKDSACYCLILFYELHACDKDVVSRS